MSNNYFDVFDVAHFKHKEIFSRENIAQVACQSIIT